METLSKAAQEVEIDHLLAEEFMCDPAFGQRFFAAVAFDCPNFEVTAVVVEPSLDGEGFGDLLVEGTGDGRRIALLIEDKITAGPAVRQAIRYAAHAERLRGRGWDEVRTILVAPASYRGERDEYDASVSLETVSNIMASADPLRLAYRRGIIARALHKRATTGVKVPDPALHRLKTEYFDFVSQWFEGAGLTVSFPRLAARYYDGDAWVDLIRDRRLPTHVRLRHRLWVSVKDTLGRVDLIASPADEAERLRFSEGAPEGAISSPFSNDKGVQVSLGLPAMRQHGGFDANIALEACLAMTKLVDWYLQK